MDDRSLMEMPVDALWDLHQSIVAMLALKLESQKAELDKQLARLHLNRVRITGREHSRPPSHMVAPKFRNPAQPDQTWSGRGRRPRWVTQLLASGMNIRDFQIAK